MFNIGLLANVLRNLTVVIYLTKYWFNLSNLLNLKRSIVINLNDLILNEIIMLTAL